MRLTDLIAEHERRLERKVSTNKTMVMLPLLMTAMFMLTIAGCSPSEDYLPETLGEQTLNRRISGEEAKEFVDNLHFQKVAAERNEIGFYDGKRGPTTIYITYYGSSGKAEADYKKMTEKISPENSIFIGGDYMDVEGKQVYRCFGMGQTHFVFFHQKQLFWISVNTVIGTDVLTAYLNYIKI
jgi:hypothetical protein